MQTIVIDFETKKITDSKIEAIQGDNTLKKVKFLLKSNFLAYDLSNKEITLTMKKNSDNKGQLLTLNIINVATGEAELVIDKKFTKQKGVYQLQLSITNKEGFEENSIIFEAEIFTNLKTEVSEEIVESIAFKELQENIENAKIENQNLKNSITEAKRFIENLDSSQNLPQMREEITELQNELKENKTINYTGNSVICNNSLPGRTTGLKLYGKTLQNLFSNSIIAQGNNTLPHKFIANGTSQKIWYYPNCVKPSTTYYVISKISKFTANNNLSFTGWLNTQQQVVRTKEDGLGIVVKECTTKSIEQGFNNNWNIELWQENTEGEVILDWLMIIEKSNLDGLNINSLNYFEGIKSVSEAESNKISILSCNNTDKKAINYKEYLKEIQLQQPLMGLENVQDTIEETEKGVEYTKNVGKRAYETGDENLPNVMTDKVNTYYVLDEPVKTILQGVTETDINTYDTVTYVSSSNSIPAVLDFSIPSNLGGIIRQNSDSINDIYNIIDTIILPAIQKNMVSNLLNKLK